MASEFFKKVNIMFVLEVVFLRVPWMNPWTWKRWWW